MKCLSVLAAVFAVLVSARSEEAVTTAQYPDADAVTLDERECVTYRSDGSSESVSESWVKILTEKGKREERTQSLHYSKRYGEAEFLYVGVIGTNGVERVVDLATTTRDATDNGSMAANIYDPLDRRLLCVIPGLTIGETVHVRARRAETKPRCQGKWADLAVMEWSQPVLRSVYEVVAPKELPVRRIAVRHPLGNLETNVVTRADGSIVYSFVATNSPQAFPEPDMPPLYTQVQHVRLSTAADWPEISRWYWSLCASHLAKTNTALVAKARELRTVEAIFRFVSQEVRYMGLTLEDTSPGYAPHDVSITFDNRYGVCRDKAGLLVAMLNAAGYAAYPVLINVGAKHDPEVPQPFFNHAVVAVDEGGRRYRLMDPTNENTRDLFPAYESDMSYLVCRPDGENLRVSPVPDPDRNALRVESKGSLSRDGTLFLDSEVRFEGINDTAYRGVFARRTPEECEKTFEKIVKGLSPGAELLRLDLSPKDMSDTTQPLVARLSFQISESVLRGRTRSALEVPFLSGRLGVANFLLRGNTSLEIRRYPLVLDSTARVSERVEVDLKDALGSPLVLPEAADEGRGYDYVRHFSVSNGCLVGERTQTVAAVEFSPSSYSALRESLKRIEAAERRRPVFGENLFADADVEILLDSSESYIRSDREWTTTNVVEKRVLTYDGKKRSAELTFSYNPSVETLELLSAVVSNRDGRVLSVSSSEKNVMDCGWAAAAPRYPAGRTLVVTLPSVEIGSVISYSVARHVTNSPVAFYRAYVFDSHQPVGRLEARVNDWRRVVVRPRRVLKESGQPPASLWRDVSIVSSNRFDRLDLHIGSLRREGLIDIRSIRDWMAKNVKVVGPGLWEVPLAFQLTDPEAVLRERYASRLDYIRTLCSLLRGAGFDADVVFAADNADEPATMRVRDKVEKPNLRAFSVPLCRIRETTGGFLGIGETSRTLFIGTESQYAPLGPSSCAGSDYFDPEKGEFGILTLPEMAFCDSAREVAECLVRENGGIDLTVENIICGASVGGFRKKYAEILPEERSRLYQSIIGGIAQAATATGELESDTESYPARRRLSCYVPQYATVEGDVIRLQLPPIANSISSFPGRVRRTPLLLSACDSEVEEMRVVFPEGYTIVEHLPDSFVFADPLDPSRLWMKNEVSSEVVDGHLEVLLKRTIFARISQVLSPDLVALVNDRSRIASSAANRTLVVRRQGKDVR